MADLNIRNVDDDLHKRLKTAAASCGMTLRDFAIKTFEAVLAPRPGDRLSVLPEAQVLTSPSIHGEIEKSLAVVNDGAMGITANSGASLGSRQRVRLPQGTPKKFRSRTKISDESIVPIPTREADEMMGVPRNILTARPKDRKCEHGQDPKFCRLGMCQARRGEK
jgi:hypothetical protein